MGTYTKSSTNRAARPRSERLRESGGVIVSTSTSVMGGASYIPSGNTHTHANLDALNMITVDDGYIYLTDTYTDETTQEQVTETVKVKAGYADKAAANADGYTLDWFIPVTVNGVLTLKLNPAYAGLWAEGWITSGDLWLHTGSANYGSKLWFGDKGSGDGYVYLYEDTDDHLHIHADKGIKLSTGSSYGIALENNVTLNSARSFTLGSGVLTWDADANAWKLSGNLYATGYITSGASNPNS